MKYAKVSLLFVLTLTSAIALCLADTLPEPTAQHLPRWRGFNLLEKFYKGSSQTGQICAGHSR
ncbi:MAG: hypothetical protein ISS71_08770 [Phycisphaerae bacterium]|nr:hypothetical protein [Phycisphaerae bacterium]